MEVGPPLYGSKRMGEKLWLSVLAMDGLQSAINGGLCSLTTLGTLWTLFVAHIKLPLLIMGMLGHELNNFGPQKFLSRREGGGEEERCRFGIDVEGCGR